ncbi:hypothetical protein E2C01_058408 [Portunus trituberculatus]|uniref:Uncharacterized protein n=1 Tax=Portunus trituberculatus TaxID=210409 RepID=A0A5B7H335_PORTR|nr:hypothetical protein [Portunus trituberculatus]
MAAGVRKPYIIWDKRSSVVIDAQVISDSSAGDCLAHMHHLKTSYYNTEDMCAWVRERSGHLPSFTTLTVNWSGMMMPASFSGLRDLGLSKD